MPMATRTAGASHPRSREYLKKKMAASTSATPATAENSFTPTSCSQSKAFSKEDGPDVGPLSGASIGEAARGSILGGGGTPGGFSGALGGDGTAAIGGVTGGAETGSETSFSAGRINPVRPSLTCATYLTYLTYLPQVTSLTSATYLTYPTYLPRVTYLPSPTSLTYATYLTYLTYLPRVTSLTY